MSESDTAGKLDEATIKQYTGGEDITARELYQSAITFKPQFTMWLSCNDLPSVKDKSLFASDRVRVIEFNRHFTDAEQDKGLKDYFESPEAMKGIFTWLVAGYFKYRRFGLAMSADMKAVVKQYERDNDLVLQFLEERCEKQDEGSTRAKTLYDQYKIWCKSNGYYVCSMKKFNAEVTAHPEWYDQKGVTNGVTVYRGIVLRAV
jgi:putative DNA primase/helicase